MKQIGEVHLTALEVAYRRRGAVIERQRGTMGWHPLHDDDWKLLTPHELRVIADLIEQQQPTLPVCPCKVTGVRDRSMEEP